MTKTADSFSFAICNDWSIESRILPAMLLLSILATAWWLQRRPLAKAARLRPWMTWGAYLLSTMVIGWSAVGIWGDPLHLLESRSLHTLIATLLFAVLALSLCIRALLTYPAPPSNRAFTPVHFAPAACALATAAVIVGCVFASHFVEDVGNERLRELYMLVARFPSDADGHDFGARAMHAVTMGLTLLAAMAAAWTTADVWWRCRSRAFAWHATAWVALVALLVASVLTVVGLLSLTQGLDSAVGNTLLCANWERTGAPWMAMFSDANNVLGIFVPVVLALGMCLLLEPLGSHRRHGNLKAIARNSRSLDVLLYVGAACLALGILHLSAAYASALATLPSAASVKIRGDICKSLSLPTGAINVSTSANASASTQVLVHWRALKCNNLAQEAQEAETADSAREFAKTTTLVFSISFSALLAAMYLPSMLLLKRAADRSRLPYVRDQANGRASRAELYLKLGIESDMLGKVGKVITALSPIFAGVIANALGTIG